jgi:hypothetical protein
MKEEFVAADATGSRMAVFNRSISWSAIVSGLVVAMVSQILLTMIGVAIGAATINPTSESNPADGLGTGALIWWFVTALISLYLGARVAGRMSGVVTRREGGYHGFLMWCTSTVIMFMVAGTVLGGIFGTGATGAMGFLTNTNAQNKIKSSIDQLDGREDGPSGSMANLNRTENTYGATQQSAPTDPNNPNRVDNNVNNNPVTPSDEARVRETGEKVASGTAKGALITLFTLLIGAAVCYWSGSRAVPHDFGPAERDRRVPGGAVPAEPLKG